MRCKYFLMQLPMEGIVNCIKPLQMIIEERINYFPSAGNITCANNNNVNFQTKVLIVK